MEFKNVHLRHVELKNGDLCVAKVDKDFDDIGHIVAFFRDGHLYDVLALQDKDMDDDHWTLLDDVCSQYMYLGVNIHDK